MDAPKKLQEIGRVVGELEHGKTKFTMKRAGAS
jgi:hypothetical protein